MKRCPKCSRTYTDETLNFCLDDGEWLVGGESDEPATATLTSEAPTRIHSTPTPQHTDAGTTISSNRKYLIAGLVGVLLVSALGIGAYRFYNNRMSNQIDSIAVMPFVNQSGNPDVEYLSDGMTETLISSLTQLPDLAVKPRSSVFRYKGKDADAKTIGKELNVGAILNGTLVQRGSDMTLHVELVDTASETLLWSADYKGPLANLVALQGEITRDVINKLRIKPNTTDEQKVVKKYTENGEAYQLYLKGRFAWNKRTERDLQLATEFFRQAIALDPDYALAYAGLADAYSGGGVVLTNDSALRRELLSKAREAARKALSIDDNLAEAHVSLGTVVAASDYDFAGAEREYTRAIDINPNYADAHYWYASLLSRFGKLDEASVEFKRAIDLEPLNLVYQANYGGHLAWAGRHDEAIGRLQKILELDENFGPTLGNLGGAYQLKGDYANTVKMRARELELRGDSEGAELLRAAFANGGWAGYLRHCTGESRPKSQSLYSLAVCRAELGENDKAMAALNRSYENREPILPRMKIDPRLEPLRDDPRFNELVRRVGFP